MMNQNPLETVTNLMNAINKGDLDTALSLYEHQAVIVTQRGIFQGRDAIRTALQGFISLKPTLKGESYKMIESENLVLYCSKWVLQGTSPDGKRVEMSGTSSDVLRRQTDGKWLIAIDNPWGTALLDWG